MSIINKLKELVMMTSCQDAISTLNGIIESLDDDMDMQAIKLYEIRKLAGQYKNSLTIGTATLANSIIEILDDTK